MYAPVYDGGMLTLSEAARSLGLKSSTLRHQIRNRRLSAKRVDGDWYVLEAEVERYRSQHRKPQPTDPA